MTRNGVPLANFTLHGSACGVAAGGGVKFADEQVTDSAGKTTFTVPVGHCATSTFAVSARFDGSANHEKATGTAQVAFLGGTVMTLKP